MKSSLSHLPETKQHQILQIVEIIKEAVSPEKVILFGSYANGNWVEDSYFENGIRYDYISDYDFLIVTKEDKEKEYVLVEKILSKCRSRFHVPVSPIIHNINFVNEGLEEGQFFFTEIIKSGILLFDSGELEFKDPKNLTKKERYIIASEYFKLWYSRATSALEGAEFYFSRHHINDAAFTLHQATERLYNTVLLVFTGYKPKTHNLDKLRKYIKPISQTLFTIFPYPIDDDQEKHLFDLLKRAYVDARYKQDYVLTVDEFKILMERILGMQKIVEKICKEKIALIENS